MSYEIESDDAVEIREIGGEFGTRNESHILEEAKKRYNTVEDILEAKDDSRSQRGKESGI